MVKEEVFLNDKAITKIEKFRKEGVREIVVISDFDRTLTKSQTKNKKILSTFALIRESSLMPKEYTAEAQSLFQKYYPIEIDLEIDEKTKYKKMEEWWKKHLELLIKYKINRKIINDIIKENPNVLREGINEFLKILAEKDVHIFIISAGLGDITKEYLKKYQHPTIHIIANFFEFSPEGYVNGYKNKIIHILNKTSKMIDKKFQQIINNKNIILLGDSLSDIKMIDESRQEDTLKIGLFNN